MPVYNADRFLKKSIESVITQTYKNWELIIVNDGSTDNSESIISEYIATHNNIRLYTINNSGSAKYPRDMAIFHSNGNYIVTLDADDYLESDYLQKMWDRLNETNADIVFPKMTFFKENTNIFVGSLPINTFESHNLYKGKELIKYTLNGWQIGCNGGLYKKEIMNNLSYPSESYKTEILMNSDEYDTRLYLLNADIVVFSEAYYYYCINENSVSRKVSQKLFHVLKTDTMICDLIAYNFSKCCIEYNLIQEQLYYNTLHHLQLYISNKKHLNQNDRKNIYLLLSESFSKIERRTFKSKSIKLKILTLNFKILYYAFKIKSICKKLNHIKVS